MIGIDLPAICSKCLNSSPEISIDLPAICKSKQNEAGNVHVPFISPYLQAFISSVGLVGTGSSRFSWTLQLAATKQLLTSLFGGFGVLICVCCSYGSVRKIRGTAVSLICNNFSVPTHPHVKMSTNDEPPMAHVTIYRADKRSHCSRVLTPCSLVEVYEPFGGTEWLTSQTPTWEPNIRLCAFDLKFPANCEIWGVGLH